MKAFYTQKCGFEKEENGGGGGGVYVDKRGVECEKLWVAL